MNSQAELLITPCGYDAARAAVMRWHYSRAMPSGKLTTLGVWEEGRFAGAVIFGRGANNRLNARFGLAVTEACELVRVALGQHNAPVSRVLAIALRQLRRLCPGLKLCASYADPEQGHHGGIYQAGGWLYLGESNAQRDLIIGGEEIHKRTAVSRFGTASPEIIARRVAAPVSYGEKRCKHLYVMPLSEAVRAELRTQAKPYPKREEAGLCGRPGCIRRGSADPHAPGSSMSALHDEGAADDGRVIHCPSCGHDFSVLEEMKARRRRRAA